MYLRIKLRLQERILKNQREEVWREHFLQMAKKQQIMCCVTRPTAITTQVKLLRKTSSIRLHGPNLSRHGNVEILRIRINRAPSRIPIIIGVALKGPQTTDDGPPQPQL